MKVIRHGEEHDPWGRPPEPFETIARRYVARPDLIVPGLRAGTKLGALAFMLKMMLTRATDLDRWERERGYPMLEAPVLAHESDEWRAAAEQKQLLLQRTRYEQTGMASGT